MNKIFFILSLFLITVTSCKKETKQNVELTTKSMDSINVKVDEHSAKNSLDYIGTYKGNLPCADCEAIEITIVLTADSYTKETIYKGKSKETFKETGKYTWNKAGNTITLLNSEAPNQYFVGENVLFQLDIDGKRIEGDLASKYKLFKVDTSKLGAPKSSEVLKTDETDKAELKNSRWRLVKLNGKLVEKDKDNKREFSIAFNFDGTFSAFAGCNNMAGSYELKEDVNRIKFSGVASTMMACNDMTIEKEFAKALETVDNYNFDGKTLKLNKAKMAPLAEFEIIK